MSSQYQHVPLGELVELVIDHRGRTPKKLGGEFTSSGVRVVSAIHIKNGRIDWSQRRRFTSQEMFDRWMPERTRAGDVLVTSEAPLGEVAQVESNDDLVISQRLFALRGREGYLDNTYLRYFLTSPAGQQRLADRATGTTVVGIRQAELLKVLIDLPPLDEQRRIAGVLGALDDLMSQCERIRSDIDDLGRALLRDRLLVGGILNVRDDIDGAYTLTSIDAVTSLVETGRRPKGGVKGIATGVPSVGAESINGLAAYDFSKTKFVPDDFAAQMKSGRLGDRDLLVYKDGGKPGDFRPKVGMFGRGFPFENMVINEHVFRVRAQPPVSESYLYFWLQQPEMIDAMRQAGTGAAVPGLNRTAFKSLPVLLPDDEKLLGIQGILDVLTSAALDLASEAREIQLLRDELLPLLMSGRVRVGEVAT